MEVISFIVILIATIYIFIKIKNISINKGKSKFIAIILALSISFLTFVVLITLVATFFQDSTKQEIKDKEKVEEKVIQVPKEESKQIEKAEKKSPPDTITTKMTFDAINSLKDNYNIKSGLLEDMPLNLEYLCSGDTACHFYANKNQVQVIYKTVNVYTDSRVSVEDYFNICSGIFIGLTNANKDLAENIMLQAFDYATKYGSSKSEILGVEITIKPDNFNKLFSCSFLKP